MAIYHLSVKPVQRSKGRSATAAAAYRAGSRIADERTGETHDYRKKGGVNFSEILTPDGSRIDRAQLWNMAEASEKRKDGTTAREYEIALPAELDAESRKELALEFGRMILKRHGVAVDISIHAPTEQGDQRNHHAHVMATTRKFENGKLTVKSDFDLSDRDRKKKNLPGRKHELEAIREEWAELVNRALARANQRERVTHKSLKAQGFSRPPTIHLGPAATAMERREEPTERGERNREIARIAPTVNELDMLKKQQEGIEAARARYADEKSRRIAEEEERIKKYELEILGERERGRVARGEARARAGIQENHAQAADSRTYARAGGQESARDQDQSGTDRLAAGSDRAARGSCSFEERTKSGTGENTGARAKYQPDQAGHESIKPANGSAGSGSEKHGTGAGEFGGRPERTFSQREAGSVEGSQGRGRSDRPTLGSDQKSGGENQFIAKIIELEKRILKLATEYKTIADLLAMARKDGGQRHHQHEEETTKQQATRRMRA